MKIPVASARSFWGTTRPYFDRRREIAGFAEAEREAGEDEPGDRGRIGQADQRENRRDGRTEHRRLGVRHRRQAPHDERDREALLGPQPVDHPAGDQKPDRVGELEREDDVGVVDLAPAELLLQRRLEDADDLPVDVVDRRREEQQRADDPAVASDRRRRRAVRRRPAERFGMMVGPLSDGRIAAMNGELAVAEPLGRRLLAGRHGEHLGEQPLGRRVERFRSRP